MAYSIKIERIGRAGVPGGRAALYEADTEIKAVTIATYEVDTGFSGPQRHATVLNAAGKLIMAYTGRVLDVADAD